MPQALQFLMLCEAPVLQNWIIPELQCSKIARGFRGGILHMRRKKCAPNPSKVIAQAENAPLAAGQ
jgi:hypothetical protein